MNNKIAVILALADVKYSLNDLEKHYNKGDNSLCM